MKDFTTQDKLSLTNLVYVLSWFDYKNIKIKCNGELQYIPTWKLSH